jgi:hypothetical protein
MSSHRLCNTASTVTRQKGVPHAENGTVPFVAPGQTARPSVAMPRATTELTQLLANDPLVGIRRRSQATPVPQAASESSVAGAELPTIQDAVLSRVIEAWPSLPRSIRAAISAMVCEETGGPASGGRE